MSQSDIYLVEAVVPTADVDMCEVIVKESLRQLTRASSSRGKSIDFLDGKLETVDRRLFKGKTCGVNQYLAGLALRRMKELGDNRTVREIVDSHNSNDGSV